MEGQATFEEMPALVVGRVFTGLQWDLKAIFYDINVSEGRVFPPG